MAEPEDLQALITTNLPDNVENFITPARVRAVLSFIKDNYAPNSGIEDFLTTQDAEDTYLEITAAEDFLEVPLSTNATYASFVTSNANGTEYYRSSFINGGTF
jgi:hypothetical protein